MSNLTPIKQRPVTAVRKPGQLLIPNRHKGGSTPPHPHPAHLPNLASGDYEGAFDMTDPAFYSVTGSAITEVRNQVTGGSVPDMDTIMGSSPDLVTNGGGFTGPVASGLRNKGIFASGTHTTDYYTYFTVISIPAYVATSNRFLTVPLGQLTNDGLANIHPIVVNGVPYAAGAFDATTFPAAGLMVLESNIDANSTEQMFMFENNSNGRGLGQPVFIAEQVVVSADTPPDISDADRLAIRQALATRWGITLP